MRFFILCFSLLLQMTFGVLSAKEGSFKFGKHIIYNGNVENNQPQGKGQLSFKKEGKTFLVGTFEGNSISNATLYSDEYSVFGNMTLEEESNKKSEQIATIKIAKGAKLEYAHNKVHSSTLRSDLICQIVKQDGNPYSSYKIVFNLYNCKVKWYDSQVAYYCNVRNHNIFSKKREDIEFVEYPSGRKLIPNFEFDRSNKMKLIISPDWFYIGDFDIERPDQRFAVYESKKTSKFEYSGRVDRNVLHGEVKYSTGEKFTGTFEVLKKDSINYLTGDFQNGNLIDHWKDGKNISIKERQKATAKEKVKEQYVDPVLSQLISSTANPKIYVCHSKQNVGYNGRGCWKHETKSIRFETNTTMGCSTSLKINLIDYNGKDGTLLFDSGTLLENKNYILFDGVIYTYKNNSLNDLKEYLYYDKSKDIIKSLDGTIYVPQIQE